MAKHSPGHSPTSRSEPSANVMPAGFETELAALKEDRTRARRMRRNLNRPGPTTWLNIGDRLWLAKQRQSFAPVPAFDRPALQALTERVKAEAVNNEPPSTLASSRGMRALRQRFIPAVLDAFADYPDEELATVTVIYAGWAFSPTQLAGTSAAKLKAQFRRHLERSGVLLVPGPLIAALHGEFEPKSAVFQLHWHVMTTVRKAAAIKAGLTATKIKGYAKTATGAVPVRRSRLRSRVKQTSYLLKGYWPCRPVVLVGGNRKRVRDPRRISEPFASLVLMWLSKQQFRDLVLMNDVWSKRKGGTEAMKQLYLMVMGDV